MKVLHISTECYPAAKAGGMGDVVGALPIYLPQHGVEASVIIPKYKNKWFADKQFEVVFRDSFTMGNEEIQFSIQALSSVDLGFPFYALDIPGKFDRPHVYLTDEGTAYSDEVERNISFQTAVLYWMISDPGAYDILHCHDHMTGLISFMMQFCPVFSSLQDKASFFTIHNGQYRGVFDWSYASLLPAFEESKSGMLDWDGMINSLATAIKCSWRISTVSPSYLAEMQQDLDTLTSLVRFESYKSVGIINGIDTDLWNPKSDVLIYQHLKRSATVFKSANKKALAAEYGFNSGRMLLSFIGRFAYEKSADLLAGAFAKYLKENTDIHFFVLGSGDKAMEMELLELQKAYPDNLTVVVAYNEKLAHCIYAASDFILMPSRFEPCGLNQMYAMRYGAIPVVRHTGGLIDTVPDIGDDGHGISFLRASEEDIIYSITRAMKLFEDKLEMKTLINRIMQIDFSWERSAALYTNEYSLTLKQ